MFISEWDSGVNWLEGLFLSKTPHIWSLLKGQARTGSTHPFLSCLFFSNEGGT